MAVGYSLNHVQAADIAAAAPYTWVDIPGVITWEPTVETDSEDVLADGSVYVTAYGNPVGSGDLTWVQDILAIRALLNGGTVSTSGVAPNTIERYELPGTYTPVPFALSDWVPNIDKFRDTMVGTRTTAPNCTAGVISRSSGQESLQELTTATKMTQDANNVMLIVEKLEDEPTFTGGVTEGGI